jgi:hypothetical protein
MSSVSLVATPEGGGDTLQLEMSAAPLGSLDLSGRMFARRNARCADRSELLFQVDQATRMEARVVEPAIDHEELLEPIHGGQHLRSSVGDSDHLPC